MKTSKFKKFLSVIAMVVVLVAAGVPMGVGYNYIYAAESSQVGVVVDSKMLKTDVKPYIENGRTYIPLSAVGTALGANTAWESSTKTVTVSKDGTSTSLVVGQPLPNNMGAAKITNGRTMVPLAYVAEVLGAEVEWSETTRTVVIRTRDVTAPTGQPTTMGAAQQSTAANSSVNPEEFAQQVFTAINARRTEQGKLALEWNEELAKGASWRSEPEQIAAYANAPADLVSFTMKISGSNPIQNILGYYDMMVSIGLYDNVDIIGVGCCSRGQNVTVGFVKPISGLSSGVGIADQLGPYWAYDMPNKNAFLERINPFDINLLISKGLSEEEIARAWEDEIIRLINVEREKAGVRELVWDASLGSAARWSTEDPAGSGSMHIGTDGSTPDERARREGWAGGSVSENACASGNSPAATVATWLSSPGHKAIMLDSDHTYVGAGFGHSDGLFRLAEDGVGGLAFVQFGTK